MGWLDRFRRLQRNFWYVCHNCMFKSGRQDLEAIFYYEGVPAEVLGRPLVRCPRCDATNTQSFEQLKQEGSDAALFGLERIVKKHPRRVFAVKRPA